MLEIGLAVELFSPVVTGLAAGSEKRVVKPDRAGLAQISHIGDGVGKVSAVFPEAKDGLVPDGGDASARSG
jgi:hypothetical protein